MRHPKPCLVYGVLLVRAGNDDLRSSADRALLSHPKHTLACGGFLDGERSASVAQWIEQSSSDGQVPSSTLGGGVRPVFGTPHAASCIARFRPLAAVRFSVLEDCPPELDHDPLWFASAKGLRGLLRQAPHYARTLLLAVSLSLVLPATAQVCKG